MNPLWQKCKLGDVITLKRGYDLPHRDREDGPVPIVSSSGITGYHKEAKVKGPGVATGRYGTLGEVFYIESDFWPLNTTLYVRDFKGNDPRFISYFLRTLGLEQQNVAGAVPGVNRNHLHMLDVQVPDFATQEKIAAILSAYDDLIENNTQRIAALEAAAHALYREWFVEFRFPGHETVEWADSELGEIPAGWDVLTLADICELRDYGYTTKAQQEPVGPKFLRITDIVPSVIDWNTVPYCEIESRKFSKYLLDEGDIVIARTGATTGYAKRLNKRHPQTIFASYLVRLRIIPEISNRMIGIMVESENYKRFIQSRLSGAAQPQANAKVLTSISIAMPPSQLQDMFDSAVEPMLDQCELLQERNIILREARDLLLPRLISGELSVERIELEV